MVDFFEYTLCFMMFPLGQVLFIKGALTGKKCELLCVYKYNLLALKGQSY
jgi:hypothetical protein